MNAHRSRGVAAQALAFQRRQSNSTIAVSAHFGSSGQPLDEGHVARTDSGISRLIHSAVAGMNCAHPRDPPDETAVQSKRLS